MKDVGLPPPRRERIESLYRGFKNAAKNAELIEEAAPALATSTPPQPEPQLETALLVLASA